MTIVAFSCFLLNLPKKLFLSCYMYGERNSLKSKASENIHSGAINTNFPPSNHGFRTPGIYSRACESPVQYARSDMRLSATKRLRRFATDHDDSRQITTIRDKRGKLWRSWETRRISAIVDLDVRTVLVAMKILNVVCPKNRF